MKRRNVVKWFGAGATGAALSACGGGGTGKSEDTSPSSVLALGLALPDPLEVANRLPAYNTEYSSGQKILPKSFDNSSRCPPAGDQGNLGSCTAWASAYGLASYVNGIGTNTLPQTKDRQGSPADMYAKLLRKRGYPCGTGTLIKDAADILVQNGIQTFASAPYSDTSCSPTSSANLFRLTGYHAIQPSDRVSLKRELASGKVLLFGAAVTNDISAIRGDAKYFATGSPIGGHAMLVVGYDDTRSAYKVLNSWGNNYGTNGFFWFDYAAFERKTFEVISPLMNGDSGKPVSIDIASVKLAAGSAILDTYYGKEYLYIYIEFTNAWQLQSYEIKNSTGILVKKSGMNQWVRGTYLVINRDASQGAYPAGGYDITLTGISAADTPLTLNAHTEVLAFVARKPNEGVK